MFEAKWEIQETIIMTKYKAIELTKKEIRKIPGASKGSLNDRTIVILEALGLKIGMNGLSVNAITGRQGNIVNIQISVISKESWAENFEELLAVLDDIAQYTGEGRINAPWREIVRSLGEKARKAAAKARGFTP